MLSVAEKSMLFARFGPAHFADSLPSLPLDTMYSINTYIILYLCRLRGRHFYNNTNSYNISFCRRRSSRERRKYTRGIFCTIQGSVYYSATILQNSSRNGIVYSIHIVDYIVWFSPRIRPTSITRSPFSRVSIFSKSKKWSIRVIRKRNSYV